MRLNSLTMILQSILKAVLMPLLIILGLGTLGATTGATTAFLITGLISTIILLTLNKNLQKTSNDAPRTTEIMKTMLRYGLPLSISTIISGFTAQFYSFLMAIYCPDQAIGNYQVALNFAVLITFFATPITTILLPTFSKLDATKEPETLRTAFQLSVKYATLLVTPATIIIMALSQPAISTLYGDKYTLAPLYLTLYSITYLYTAIGSLSIGNLLNSQGETKTTMKLTLTTTATGIPLSLLLIPSLGIIGAITALLISGVPSLIIGLSLIKRQYGTTVDWPSSTRILTASALAGAVAYLFTSQLSLENWIKLIIGATLFLITYTILIPLIGAINRTDIQNLREVQKELGRVSYISTILLNIIEKLTHSPIKHNNNYDTNTT